MPRAKVILQSEYPYNITARCINREWFQIPMEEVWEIYCEELSKVHFELGLQIHSFILMSNHFHLIASTPKANISECMHRFMQSTSRRLTRAGNRINQSYAGRHYKCVLHRDQYFLNVYKYNYRNPIAAGLCQRVESYPYSTLQFLLKKSSAKIPLVYDEIFFADPDGTLEWLNTEPEALLVEGIRYGLKHQFFKSKKGPVARKELVEDRMII